MKVIKFWENTKHTDKVIIIPNNLYEFLTENGYRYMLIGEENEPVPVKIEGKIIARKSMDDLQKFTIDTITNADERFEIPEIDKRKIRNALAANSGLFSNNKIYFLTEINPEFVKDTAESSYVFFKNSYCFITKEQILFKSYEDLDGYIFQDDIIDFDLSDTAELLNQQDGDFYKFIKRICTDNSQTKAEKKYMALRSIIGYLLHRYKDPGFAKAVIFMDEDYTDYPEGGTGKGILVNALAKVRSTVIEDCAKLDMNGRFTYSRVNLGTCLLGLDDVPKSFNFQKLFSLITEGIVIERKHENRYKIPYEESPKIVITTNYTIIGEGDSHIRRKIEFELHRYFNAKHNPEDEFGRLLFHGWNTEQWELFYMFMLECIQYYLKEGLIEPPEVNLYLRKLKQEAGEEFIEYCIQNFVPGAKYDKKVEYDKYYSKNPGIRVNQKTFTSWIKLFADGYGIIMNETHSGDQNFFELSE